MYTSTVHARQGRSINILDIGGKVEVGHPYQMCSHHLDNDWLPDEALLKVLVGNIQNGAWLCVILSKIECRDEIRCLVAVVRWKLIK